MDDEWTQVSKRNKKATVITPPVNAAAIRAQVIALRTGKPAAADPRTARPQPSTTTTSRPSGSAARPGTVTVHHNNMQPPQEQMRLLAPLVDPEVLKRRPNGDKYYQEFIRCTIDAKGNLTYRFHKTDILSILANGDVKLTTGGWYTATTMNSMNDVLHCINIQVRCSGDARDGNWTVSHAGKSMSYYDDMVLPAQFASDRNRLQSVMQHARELGITCQVSVKQGPALGLTPTPAQAPAQAQAQALAQAQAQTSPGSSSGAAAASAAAPVQAPAPGLSLATGAAPTRSYQELYAQMQEDQAAQELTIEQKLSAVHFNSFVKDDVSDEEACIVCMAVARDTIIIPCGHLVLCKACSSGISSCPICRSDVMELLSLA